MRSVCRQLQFSKPQPIFCDKVTKGSAKFWLIEDNACLLALLSERKAPAWTIPNWSKRFSLLL